MSAKAVMLIPIKLSNREVGPHKAVVGPRLGARNVLTNSPWTFVSLWLKRNHQDEALFYWDQAYEFYKVSKGLPLQSAPLLLYYSFMNAAKALLASKAIQFDHHHGVSEHKRPPGTRIDVSNESLKIRNSGILPSLSLYYAEQEAAKTHNLKEIFFNMVFIHRTYCLTYTSQKEMFLPLTQGAYKLDKPTGDVYFTAHFEKNVSLKSALSRLPPSFVFDPTTGSRAIRSASKVNWRSPSNPNTAEVANLRSMHQALRKDLHYINGTQALWYLKATTPGPKRLERQLPTLILAAMHRLSEVCRYRPLELASFLAGQKNWLLSEFIGMSPDQFIDEISSEITGHQFLIPNVRTAI